MGVVELPYLCSSRAKGRLYHYYRRGGLRRRIPGQPGEAGFLQAYQEMHDAAEAAARRQPLITKMEPGTLRALIAAYRATDSWLNLRESTKVDYEKSLRPLAERYGHLVVKGIHRPFVFGLQDKYSRNLKTLPDGSKVTVRTPRRANGMIAVLSLLMSWGVDRGWRPDNPCLRPKKLRGGAGWRAWTEEEFARFMAAETTPAELRLVAMLAAGTGQRGEDLVAMKWADFDGTAIQVAQLKGGQRIWVPCPAELRQMLATAPRVAETILARPNNRLKGGKLKPGQKAWAPWKIDHFRHAMGDAIKAAGLAGIVVHGFRALAAVRYAEVGCSDAEIQSITGHKTAAMAAHYRRNADQKRTATAAVARLDAHSANARATSSVKPQEVCSVKPLKGV